MVRSLDGRPEAPPPARADLVYAPRAEIEAIQAAHLQRTLDLCARGHPYYRARWAAAGVEIASIRGLEELERLPITTKHDFMSDPEAFRLQLPELSIQERTVWEMMYTTGTTSGRPSPVYTTTHDYYSWLYHSRETAKFDRLTAKDVFANLYPLTPMPMGAFVRGTHAAAAIGAAVVTCLPGSPYPEFPVHNSLDRGIELIALHRATVVMGVASYMRRVVIRAQELGADFSSVRVMFLGGESASSALRGDIRGRLLALGSVDPRVVSRYGSTELGYLPECQEGSGWHNPTPDLLYLEVVDEAGRRLPDGEQGLLCATHLNRRGTVLVRYLVGDVTTLSYAPCPHCGRNGGRITSQPVRTNDLVKVRGMLINPELIKEELLRIPELAEFQIVLTKQDPADPLSMDDLLVRVAPAAGAAPQDLSLMVAKRVRDAVSLSPRVEIAEASELFDPERSAKPTRLVDLR
jgi:phenylacetate-CoA ligase